MQLMHAFKYDSEAMIQTIPNHQEVLDDMSVEVILLATIGIATPIIVKSGNPDTFAILGAVLAAIVALLKATSEKREWTQKGIVIVGTTVVGSTAPSAAIHYWWPEAIQKLIWQAWGLMGFISGIVGWMFLWAGILAYDASKERMWQKALKRAEKKISEESDIT